ncbi:unnamed protein product [Closterium sp. NIES-53]
MMRPPTSPLTSSPSSPPPSASSLPCHSAVLHRSRIVLVDEATTNVDRATDVVIKSTIRCHFAASTVMPIAHRLHTIVHAHKVRLPAMAFAERGEVGR